MLMPSAKARLWLTLALSIGASRAGAQTVQQSVQGEVRLDGLFARTSAVQAGYGLSVPAGIYMRTGLVGGVGVGRHGAEGRVDLISRFTLDPFRQSRWTPYVGAGLSGRFRPDQAGGARAYLLAYLGIEGPLPFGQRRGWMPAVEVGFGGGTRVGVILRRGIIARR